MPAVDVAMKRSLRGGFLDLVAASVRPVLRQRRDLQQQITDVKTAFSSWDNCMQVNYCKWPVIALIIIGGLLIFSLTWCIIRCACCGRSFCCACFSCLKCCGNCCGCCDPPRGSRHKYLDEPYIPPHQGYKSQDPMHAGFGPTVPAVKAPDYPQYAVFETGKKNDDALPQMPSWEGAEKKKVLVEEEDDAVEMNSLQKPEASGQSGTAAANGAAAASQVSPSHSRSPVNRTPYGPPGAGPGSDGFYGSAAADNDPYAPGAPSFNQPGMAYSEPDQGYGMAVPAMGPGRRSPRAYNNGGYNDGYNDSDYAQANDYPPPAGRQGSYDAYGGGARHQPYDNYDNYGPANNPRQSPHPIDTTPYLQQHEPRRSPAPQEIYDNAAGYGPQSRRSPAPQGQYGGYGGPDPRRSPAPSRQYAHSPDPVQPLSAPPPQRQYNGGSNPSPLRNDAGFDFGFSSPSLSAMGGYRQPSPVGDQHQQQNHGQGGGGYPGYKPYQPLA
ncbi:hypothetical protein VTK26DRAFT_8490 [Humicola hyalothermophila]